MTVVCFIAAILSPSMVVDGEINEVTEEGEEVAQEPIVVVVESRRKLDE